MKSPLALKEYTEANRDAWNEVMPRHQQAAKEKWDAAFSQPGFVALRDEELALLKNIGVAGKAVAHLCCNNGIELLSLKNLGAGECVGFDISDLAIQEAQERANRCHIDCRYVRSDVYEIGPEYEHRFDLVYLTAGTLGWLPDLPLFFAKVAALLRENGQVFIYEMHPFSEMLPFDDAEEDVGLRIVAPYFTTEPDVEYGDLDYVGKTAYPSTKPLYWFVHTLSDILMALIENRLSIEHVSEYETDISSVHRRIEQFRAGIPLSFALVGRKGPAWVEGRAPGEPPC
ncbi:MAG: class I SAM-dependent methyltransferase [Anaerolineae bacterium]|nr:class I SAM-dependent methyltransferase [Anaerolineae bacterium]